MKQLKNGLTLLMLCLCFSSQAQDETEKKCVDYPALTHMNNFEIQSCEKIYNSYDVPVGEEKTKTVEGMLYSYYYALEDSKSDNVISWLQLHRNYENAIKKINGTIVYCNPAYNATESFLLKKEGKEIYIVVEGGNYSMSFYRVYVIEKEEMKQELDANGMYEALSTDGHIALHINFETGKSVIKEDSKKIVNDIFDMLQSNQDIKISIEGHTDNVGNAASNKTLSESRAKAVMDALTAKGISKSRLSSKGWGSTKPVSDNSTEEGRADNRRVEIIKL